MEQQIVRAPSILLSAVALTATDKPKWIQIAYLGDWKGHHQGPFSLVREHFDQMVANLHAHPAYKGGTTDVVPFDFDHASEMPPTSAAVALAGKPAQGWVRELEVREGKNGPELWALSRVLEPAKSYLRDGKIRWVSAAIDFNARDLVTGRPCGAALTSVAFTNQPFLRALPAIAASVRPMPQGTADMKLTPLLLSSLAIVTLTPTDTEIEEAIVKLSNRNRDLEKENAELKKTSAEADVDAALLSYGPKDENGRKMLRPSLLSHRLSNPAEFAATYPRVPVEMAALTTRQTPTAPATGHRQIQSPVQNRSLSALGVSGGRVTMSSAAPSGAADDETMQFATKLLHLPGANKHERAMAFVRQNGGKDLSFEAVHEQASMLLRQYGIPREIVDVTELFAQN
jgi:phage I-like protein